MEPPQAPVRVLVVDDSVVMRRIVARALERDGGIATTESAGNGQLALAKIADRRPDVVVLDLEMPVLDGFQTLAELRRIDPSLPVVLFSSVDERAATRTLEALSLGATDFVVKPIASGVSEAEAYVEQHLTPLVKALAARRAPAPAAARPSTPALGASRAAVIVVGVSTGGPDALVRVVRALPVDLPVPMLVVQHMPPMFTRLLAERLDRVGGIAVREAQDGERLAPATVYIAPGNRHLALVAADGGVRAVLTDGPPENSCRPAADVLFRAAAEVYGAAALGVVMTGMGRDGLRGCEAIRAAGGQVVVQDPSTAVVASMPEAVLAAGLAQASLSVELLVPELLRRVPTSGRT